LDFTVSFRICATCRRCAPSKLDGHPPRIEQGIQISTAAGPVASGHRAASASGGASVGTARVGRVRALRLQRDDSGEAGVGVAVAAGREIGGPTPWVLGDQPSVSEEHCSADAAPAANLDPMRDAWTEISRIA
jgi:hypothetical protein